jgi:ubiquinone/menaquinone biosynthesis C-methylase UbiE
MNMHKKTDFKEIKTKKILDIHSGPGQSTSFLSGNRNEVFVCDVSGEIPPFFPDKNNNVRADCNRLPFKNDYFDIIVCIEVFERINSYPGLIKEISRILKINGVCIISSTDGMWDSPIHFRGIFRRLPPPISDLIMGRANNIPDLKLHTDVIGHKNLEINPELIRELFERKNFHFIMRSDYCGKFGSLIIESYYAVNKTVQFIIFPIYRLLIYFDRFSLNPKFWQYSLIMKKTTLIRNTYFPVDSSYTVFDDISVRTKI